MAHTNQPRVIRPVPVSPTTYAAPRLAAPSITSAPPPTPYRGALTWAYGVTTHISRLATLLPRTLASLAAGGFDRPRLFADGVNTLATDISWWRTWQGLDVTFHHPSVGCFANWLLAAWELYLRQPTADRYAIFQDDMVCCRGLRAYLEGCLYPTGTGGRAYLNLFNFRENPDLRPHRPVSVSWKGWYPSSQKGRGAVALVFDRAAFHSILMDQQAVGHMLESAAGVSKSARSMDRSISDASKLVKPMLTEYVHYPSLVQHTGDNSVRDPQRHQPSSPCFAGEQTDATSFLPTA